MINKTRRSRKFLFGILSIVLMICMLAGALPLYAAEASEEATDAAAEEKPATVAVVIAAKDIPQGTYITDEYVEIVNVPNYNIPANVMSKPEDIMTKYAAIDIYGGEYLYSDQISSKRVSKVNNDVRVTENFECGADYLVVTDYILADTGKDVSALLQELIDQNPKSTIYFPDGEYVLSNPVHTPAAAAKSVSLHLSDGAVVKAADDWRSKDGYQAMFCLGAALAANDINSVGSYYSFIGGTLDGNGKANGISIDSGRESLIRDVCIKNAKKGIVVEKGANSGSSDIDFEDITIIGDYGIGTMGIHVIGYDNTFTNIRIYNVETGMKIESCSLLKNIQIYALDPSQFSVYKSTYGILETASHNHYSQCTVVNYATAYSLNWNPIFFDNTAIWNHDACKEQQIAVKQNHHHIAISGVRAEFYGESDNQIFFKTKSETTIGIMEGCMFDESLEDSGKAYEKFLLTPLIPIS